MNIQEKSAADVAEDGRFDIFDENALRELIGQPAERARWKFTKALTETQTEFIQRSPFCLLSTLDAQGVPCVSPKGDAPGFVQVAAPNMLLIPEREGNKLIFTLLNILQHPEVQLLFLVPNTCETLRVSGTASLTRHPDLRRCCAAGGQDALLVIRVQITECFYHCAKAFKRSQLWNPNSWPTTRVKIQIGRIMAKNGGKDAKWIEEYEQGAEQRLKIVEDHYIQNVWKGHDNHRRELGWPMVFASALVGLVGVCAFRRLSARGS